MARYEPDERERAKAEGLALVTFDLTTVSPAVAKRLGVRGVTFSGPVPPELAERMYEAFVALWKERPKTQPAAGDDREEG